MNLKPFVYLLACASLVLTGFILGRSFNPGCETAAAPSEPWPVDSYQAALLLAGGWTGRPAARVTLLLFAGPACPDCRQFLESQTWQAVEALAAGGRVRCGYIRLPMRDLPTALGVDRVPTLLINARPFVSTPSLRDLRAAIHFAEREL